MKEDLLNGEKSLSASANVHGGWCFYSSMGWCLIFCRLKSAESPAHILTHAYFLTQALTQS